MTLHPEELPGPISRANRPSRPCLRQSLPVLSRPIGDELHRISFRLPQRLCPAHRLLTWPRPFLCPPPPLAPGRNTLRLRRRFAPAVGAWLDGRLLADPRAHPRHALGPVRDLPRA